MKLINVILASGSPRRKGLLKKIVKRFRVVVSEVNEGTVAASSPKIFAKKAAILKAQAVAKQNKDSIVIGADTIVVLRKKVLGKPKSRKEAIAMLRRLSGKTHKVMTGIAVVFPGSKIVSAVATTKVKMKKISDQDIFDYVATGSPLDKAGGYGIQEIEEAFIDKIEGDFDNVVGLPTAQLRKLFLRSRQ